MVFNKKDMDSNLDSSLLEYVLSSKLVGHNPQVQYFVSEPVRKAINHPKILL